MSEEIEFVSLFAGVGGFDLGFEQAGMKCAAQVEIDKAARSVLNRRWPGVPKLEDVRKVGAHNLPKVPVVCGGFPCQDLSVAGKRMGISGERSGLFFEMMRIIAELLPDFAVIENVPGLLSGHTEQEYEYGVCLHCGFNRWRRLHHGWTDQADADLSDSCLYVDDGTGEVYFTPTGEYVWRFNEDESPEYGQMGECLYVDNQRRKGFCTPDGYCRSLASQAAPSATSYPSAYAHQESCTNGETRRCLDGGIETTGGNHQNGNLRPEPKGTGSRLHTANSRISTVCPYCGRDDVTTQSPRPVRSYWMGAVIREFARIGYVGGWTCLDAQFFGLAQRRRRIFGVFTRLDSGVTRCAEILALTNRLRWHPTQGRAQGKEIAGTLGGGAGQRGWADDLDRAGAFIPFDDRNITSATNRSNPQIGDPCHTLHASPPAIAALKGAAIGRKPENGPQYGEVLTDGTCYTLNASEQHAVIFEPRFARNGRGAPDTVASPLMATDGAHGRGDNTPVVAFGWNKSASQTMRVDETTDSLQGSASSNPAVAELAPKVGANSYSPSKAMSGSATDFAIGQGQGVRRLTPVECERLQGFPDGHTEGQADSVRYRQMGNAVAVPVVRWIGKQLMRYYHDPN